MCPVCSRNQFVDCGEESRKWKKKEKKSLCNNKKATANETQNENL